MKAEQKYTKAALLSASKVAALRVQFERCKEEISTLDWLSEGSVGENKPGNWRWTRKVSAKTVSVALSEVQAVAFAEAIANHRRLEHLIREMRSLSQTYLLEAIEGPVRRKPGKIIPNRA
jgi:hypothetical protein